MADIDIWSIGIEREPGASGLVVMLLAPDGVFDYSADVIVKIQETGKVLKTTAESGPHEGTLIKVPFPFSELPTGEITVNVTVRSPPGGRITDRKTKTVTVPSIQDDNKNEGDRKEGNKNERSVGEKSFIEKNKTLIGGGIALGGIIIASRNNKNER